MSSTIRAAVTARFGPIMKSNRRGQRVDEVLHGLRRGGRAAHLGQLPVDHPADHPLEQRGAGAEVVRGGALRQAGPLVHPDVGQGPEPLGAEQLDGGGERALAVGGHALTIKIVRGHYERSNLLGWSQSSPWCTWTSSVAVGLVLLWRWRRRPTDGVAPPGHCHVRPGLLGGVRRGRPPGWLGWSVFAWLLVVNGLGDVLMVHGRPASRRSYLAAARDVLSGRRPLATAHALLAPTVLVLVFVAALGV